MPGDGGVQLSLCGRDRGFELGQVAGFDRCRGLDFRFREDGFRVRAGTVGGGQFRFDAGLPLRSPTGRVDHSRVGGQSRYLISWACGRNTLHNTGTARIIVG
ncbi:hypothetical protein AB0I58_44930, partial [Spirillospora sp. NPDC050365]